MKKYLLKEIEYHLRMLNNETIDKDDFVNAITEIVEHYKD
jgi:predicted small metal-binding protein